MVSRSDCRRMGLRCGGHSSSHPKHDAHTLAKQRGGAVSALAQRLYFSEAGRAADPSCGTILREQVNTAQAVRRQPQRFPRRILSAPAIAL